MLSEFQPSHKAFADFAARILGGHSKLLRAKTAAYRNSVPPALSRLLVDRNAELNYHIQELMYVLFHLPYYLWLVGAENFTFQVK